MNNTKKMLNVSTGQSNLTVDLLNANGYGSQNNNSNNGSINAIGTNNFIHTPYIPLSTTPTIDYGNFGMSDFLWRTFKPADEYPIVKQIGNPSRTLSYTFSFKTDNDIYSIDFGFKDIKKVKNRKTRVRKHDRTNRSNIKE